MNRPRDTEIGHIDVVVTEEDVLGLDVAVKNVVLVRVVQRLRNATRNAHGFVERQTATPREQIAQRASSNERHDVVGVARALTRIM